MSISRRTFLEVGAAGAAAAWKGLEGLAAPKPARDAAGNSSVEAGATQIAIPRVQQMPNLPQPFKMRDWRQLARDYDALVFDINARGEYLPLVWINKSHINYGEDTFGQYVTV